MIIILPISPNSSLKTASGKAAALGKRKGHAAIRDLFKNFQQLISFSQHMVMNPIIEIDGNNAKATWYFLGPFTFRKDNAAQVDCRALR